MAANVLNSRQAIEMSVFVVRAFIKMREQLLNRAELEKRLAEIMKGIHNLCHDIAEEYGTPGNYVNGANIAGFIKVANAMLALGLI